MGGPQEIIAAPLNLYLADVGTAFPDVDEAPGVGWTLIGTSGKRNYTEDGVTVQHPQSITEWRAAGSVGAIKAFRTEEGCVISVTVADLKLEAYRLALNGNAIATAAAGVGEPGTKTIGLSRGANVTEYALLARGVSPEDNTLVAQYQVARVYVGSEPEAVYRKGEPAALALEFMALEDPNASSEDERFGVVVVQTEAAET